MKKRLLIVDDHPLFREGLKSLINRSSDYQVVGEAGSAEEALRLAKELKPDLVTMDISLPEKSGIDATREILRSLPATRMLIVSMHPKFEFISEAFKAGAHGYVVKESASAKLIQALDALCRGEFYLDGGVSMEVVTKLMTEPKTEAVIDDEQYSTLSPREQQIMRQVVEGIHTKEIASQLGLSPKTVENHRANLMKKLGMHSKMELVRYAVKLGLIDVDQWKE